MMGWLNLLGDEELTGGNDNEDDNKEEAFEADKWEEVPVQDNWLGIFVGGDEWEDVLITIRIRGIKMRYSNSNTLVYSQLSKQLTYE